MEERANDMEDRIIKDFIIEKGMPKSKIVTHTTTFLDARITISKLELKQAMKTTK